MIVNVLSKLYTFYLRVTLLLFLTFKVFHRTPSPLSVSDQVKANFGQICALFTREALCIVMLHILSITETLNYFAKLTDIP